jgi:hypothetical protein
MARKIVFWICCINGLSAVFFGGLMMLFPIDTPLGLGLLLPAMGISLSKTSSSVTCSGQAWLSCSGMAARTSWQRSSS